MADNNEAKVLRKIADKLYIWRESAPCDERGRKRWANLPEKGREIAREALRLLRDNEDLLYRCKSNYGANRECEEALDTLKSILGGMRTHGDPPESIERYVGWGDQFALLRFISELRRWADEVEKKLQRHITLGVAVYHFDVSRTTLMRALKDGRLKSHRPKKHSKTTEHLVSLAEVSSRWNPRRQENPEKRD